MHATDRATGNEREMDLGLTQDQAMLADSVGRFLAAEVGAAELRKMIERPDMPAKIWRGLSGLGVHGLMIPEEHGGAGMGLADLIVVAEKCGAAALPVPFLSHACAALAVRELADPGLCDTLLPALASGDRLATVGFAESGARAAAWVERADAADVVVILCGNDGLYVLNRAEGALNVTPEGGADLTRPCFSVALDKARIRPLAPAAGARLRAAWAIMLAADAWGIGQRFLTNTRDYAVTRQTFGRKIGEYQSIKHPLADMAVSHGFAQLLLRRAAQAWDAGEAASAELACLAKAHITHEVVGMARQCVEMMGAFGFTWEGGDHIWLKRAMFDCLNAGTPPALRREIAAARGGDNAVQDRTLTRVWRRKL